MHYENEYSSVLSSSVLQIMMTYDCSIIIITIISIIYTRIADNHISKLRTFFQRFNYIYCAHASIRFLIMRGKSVAFSICIFSLYVHHNWNSIRYFPDRKILFEIFQLEYDEQFFNYAFV